MNLSTDQSGPRLILLVHITNPTRRWTFSLGAIASLLLHLLLIAPALWGAASHHQPPNDEGSGSHSRSTNDDGALIVTFLEETETAAKAAASHATPALMPSPKTFLKPIPDPDIPLPPRVALSDRETEEDTSPVEVSGAVDPSRALLFGRYIGQITARIDRAWLRPRASLPDRFQCRARIVQAKDGAVREIELEQCTADPQWQLSLVRAIQSASPLPAPPDPTVFSRTLRINFSSEPFSSTADPAGFEPAPHTVMR